MKHKILIPLLLFFSVLTLKAQDIAKQNFQQAYQEITSMLEGKQTLDFEKAVFLTENAYRDNSLNYEDFKAALDVHSTLIGQLIKNNDIHDWKQFVRGNMGIAPDMEVEAKERYRKALANYAIFTYLTDTLTLKFDGQEFLHLPYTYSNDDPFGTADWKNSQTTHLLETQKGNCYSLVTLFKIFSERFKSDANIVTAPQHIYIEHRDPKGSRFNVEVATRSFPDFGSIQTLTYTTSEGLLNGISMRKLDLKQSVGLCLVYLAKGHEYKNKIKDDEFILTCANTALQHDPKNLNALLLKAQVYEQRVMKKLMPSAPYEKMLAEYYKLGYRQMPDDMREIILSKIQGRPSTVTPTDKTLNTFADIGEQSRTVTLSNGLFEEFHTPQKIVRYGRTIFDTEKSKIVKFLDEDISSYQVDPVVFALSVDPLTKEFPWNSPYAFAENDVIRSIDLEGAEKLIVSAKAQALFTYIKALTHEDIILQRTLIGEINKKDLENKVHIYFGVSSSITASGLTLGADALLRYAKFVDYYDKNPKRQPVDSDELDRARQVLKDIGTTPNELIEKNKAGIDIYAVIVNPSNDNDLKSEAKDYAHEVDLHLKDNINGNKTSMGQEHINGYGREYYRKHSDTSLSPNDNEVDPNSKMGKLNKRIDDADKKVKSKSQKKQ
ncbi:MAG: hypothetical protein ACKO96_36460 [Flammeovirgaceae bacterium]